MRHVTILTCLVIGLSGIIAIRALSPLAVGIIDDPVSEFTVMAGCAEFTPAEHRRAGQLVIGWDIRASRQYVGKRANRKCVVIRPQKSEGKNAWAIYKRKAIIIQGYIQDLMTDIAGDSFSAHIARP